MDREAWRAANHGVTESWTRLSDWTELNWTDLTCFPGTLAFSMIWQMLAIWSLVSLPFLNPAWTSGILWFTYYWSLSWRTFSIILLACKTVRYNFEYNCLVFWTIYGIAFLWDWNENWPFPVLGPLLSFPNLLAYWVQHLHSIIF